jgi:hypothetical protein
VISVLLRPLQDIIVNSGAPFLEICGVRTMLAPLNVHNQTGGRSFAVHGILFPRSVDCP